jgi:arabinogalactan endo-1,4-beta-galactosidase
LKNIYPFFLLVFLPAAAIFGRTEPFILGADISWLPESEARGVKYSDGSVQKDVFEILKDHGFNYIRLRLFNDPKAASGGSAATTGAVYSGYSSQGFCDLAHTKAMALRIKAAGMRFCLDFHYSDNWADPGKQYKPHAWANATFSALTDSVREFTKYVISELQKQGTTPHSVQVGNEITSGTIWPDGRSGNWANLATLLKAGIAGVKAVDSTIKIVMHIDKGGDNAATRGWVDKALANGVVFDILGESCYTKYQGQPSAWKSNFIDLATRYPDISFIIAEYSQAKRAANDIMFNLPDGRGLGTFIWEPLQYEEAIFTNSKTNSFIDTFSQMAKDYGNDTFATKAGDWTPMTGKSTHFAPQLSKWFSGFGPLRYYCLKNARVQLSIYTSAGRQVGRAVRDARAGDNVLEIRPLAPGYYFVNQDFK